MVAGESNALITSPIDLPTALRLAGAQNLDVQIARERLAEARANHESAVEQFFPWISPGVSYRRHDDRIQDVAGNVFDVNKQSYTVGGTLGAQMEIGDAIYKSLAARQLIQAAAQALDAQRQDSLLSAALGYFELAKAQAAVGVAEQSLKIYRDYEDQLRRAVEAGIAFKGDELRVRVQTGRSLLTLRQVQEQRVAASARLAQILHLEPVVELIARDADLAPLSLTATNAALDPLIQQALQTRPELKQSRALMGAARKTKAGAVFGPLIPGLGVQAFWGGLGGGKNGDIGNFGPSEDYVAALGWRIGPGGLFDRGRIHAAEARLKSAGLISEKLRDEIVRQVVEALSRVQSLADQIATARQALNAAEETLRLTQSRKEFAVGIVLENIQAEQELTRVRLDYFNIVAEYNKAQYSLSKAVGSLSGQTAVRETNN